MQQSLFQSKRRDIAIRLRMSQRLVDVIELDALGCIVVMNRLQTGDVAEERWSRQAAEDEDRVVAF